MVNILNVLLLMQLTLFAWFNVEICNFKNVFWSFYNLSPNIFYGIFFGSY